MALIFRTATRADLPAILALIADDPLGQARETGELSPYLAAFDAITADPAHHLIVGELSAYLAAFCQLTLIPGLSRQGATRALVESVRVHADLRSQGVGASLMAEAESRARAAGATLIQLTTDTSRPRAHAFYTRLGYTPSHLGFKKPL